MRKLFFMACILLLAEISTAQVNIGMKAGMNISSINYDTKPTQRNIEKDLFIGYLGGITFQYFAQKNMGIQMEALYIRNGFKTKFNPDLNTQYERSIDYVSIPFMMHALFGNKNLSISLILGPFGSYAIRSEEILTEGEAITKRPYTFDPEIDNRLEFGLKGGVGIRNQFSFGILGVEGKYSYSFISLFKWQATYPDPEMRDFFQIPETAQNQGYQITFSYYYPF